MRAATGTVARVAATTPRDEMLRALEWARDRASIDTTHELVEIVKAAVPAPAQFGGGHPVTGKHHAPRQCSIAREPPFAP